MHDAVQYESGENTSLKCIPGICENHFGTRRGWFRITVPRPFHSFRISILSEMLFNYLGQV